MLRQIRREIAAANGISYFPAECHHIGDCPGTCPVCDEEIRFLDSELNRKAKNGEKITISGISAEAFLNDIWV